MRSGLDSSREISLNHIYRDVGSFGQRTRKFLSNGENAALLMGGLAGVALIMPAISELAFAGALGIGTYSMRVQRKNGLPMQVPMSANTLDPKEIDLGTKKPVKGKGIVYIGNDQKTQEEIWLTDTQARTHMMFLGTTGSGKAQPLDALVLTPNGWVTMGEIRRGDVVSTPDGKRAKVLEIFPQGVKEIFRLTLSSGRSTRCCAEHLWRVRMENKDYTLQTKALLMLQSHGKEIYIPVFEDRSISFERLDSIVRWGKESAQCIYIDHVDHLYVTDDGIVTHNTEFLISVAFNALVHGSGLIYVDGKADNSLYGKLYSMARFMGREDDVLLINFQTGAKDVFGAQPRKMSNTLNPFAVGSSGMLTQLVVGLMSGGKEGGKSDVWENRAISFVEALLKPLVYLRDHYGLLLDVEIIRNYFNLEPLAALLTDNMEKTKNDFNADIWVEKKNARFPGIGYALSGLAAYMDNLPGINWAKPMAKQESVVSEQHGYITMQLIRTFNSLSDTYGYIMKTPLAEIDFLDVFINRRILVVLLPALEKSPPELTNLGRIIVASIKSVMAVGLGADVEGDWAKVIDAKPTTSPSPYMCILDEYGYYAVEGFAVVPAQARSLGFSAIFAGQDLPAFEKASKPEAESTLANTTTKFCGKLECTKTFEYFKSVAGEAFYSRTGGFNNTATSILSHAYLDNQSAQIEKMSRISDMDLRSQISGEWHMFFADRIVRINSFFSNPRKVKKLRTNHFIPVAPPSDEVARKLNEVRTRLADQIAKGFANETADGIRYALNDAATTKFKAYADLLVQPSEEIAALSGFDRTVKEFDAMLRAALTTGSGLTESIERDLGVDSSGNDEESLPDDFMERMDRSGRRSSIDDFADMDEEDDPLGDMEFDEDSPEIDFSAHADKDDPSSVLFNDTAEEDRAEDRLSGLLDRDRTHAGLASIESQLGRPRQVSDVIASEVAFEMSASTHYPSVPLAEEPDLEDFFEVSNLLQSELRDHGETSEEKGR